MFSVINNKIISTCLSCAMYSAFDMKPMQIYNFFGCKDTKNQREIPPPHLIIFDFVLNNIISDCIQRHTESL